MLPREVKAEAIIWAKINTILWAKPRSILEAILGAKNIGEKDT